MYKCVNFLRFLEYNKYTCVLLESVVTFQIDVDAILLPRCFNLELVFCSFYLDLWWVGAQNFKLHLIFTRKC